MTQWSYKRNEHLSLVSFYLSFVWCGCFDRVVLFLYKAKKKFIEKRETIESGSFGFIKSSTQCPAMTKLFILSGYGGSGGGGGGGGGGSDNYQSGGYQSDKRDGGNFQRGNNRDGNGGYGNNRKMLNGTTFV